MCSVAARRPTARRRHCGGPEGGAPACAGLPADALQLVEDTTRASANELMTASGYVDLLIPGAARA